MGNKDNKIFSIQIGRTENKSNNKTNLNSNVDFYQTPLSKNAQKDILLISIQNEKLDHNNASDFITFIKNKLETEYRLIIFDFSASISMDSVFLGSVILILKLIGKKHSEACLILNSTKFTKLLNVEYSINKLKTNVKIFSTVQQVEDHFEIKNINDQIFTLSKVV